MISNRLFCVTAVQGSSHQLYVATDIQKIRKAAFSSSTTGEGWHEAPDCLPRPGKGSCTIMKFPWNAPVPKLTTWVPRACGATTVLSGFAFSLLLAEGQLYLFIFFVTCLPFICYFSSCFYQDDSCVLF